MSVGGDRGGFANAAGDFGVGGRWPTVLDDGHVLLMGVPVNNALWLHILLLMLHLVEREFI